MPASSTATTSISNAYVDDFAARHAGASPLSDRLYMAHRPRRRDVSVAFLVDASGSTDAWVNGGRHVIDLKKEAALVFCEALEALGDRYAVYTFSGRGARDVHVSRVGRALVRTTATPPGVASPVWRGRAFTRLGAPIRHLTALLTQQRTRQRLLFLNRTASPTMKMSMWRGSMASRIRARRSRKPVCKASTCSASPSITKTPIYLPQMFGPHGYTILWDVTPTAATPP